MEKWLDIYFSFFLFIYFYPVNSGTRRRQLCASFLSASKFGRGVSVASGSRRPCGVRRCGLPPGPSAHPVGAVFSSFFGGVSLAEPFLSCRLCRPPPTESQPGSRRRVVRGPNGHAAPGVGRVDPTLCPSPSRPSLRLAPESGQDGRTAVCLGTSRGPGGAGRKQTLFQPLLSPKPGQCFSLRPVRLPQDGDLPV